jgi:Tol biopolymer transport system component
VAVSPDGQRLLYLRTRPATHDVALVVASADGGAERVIGSLPPSGFVPEYGPAWSPDGERIACVDNADGSGDVATSRLVTMRSDGSDRRPLTTRDLYFVRQLTWAPDGGAIFLVGQDQPSAYAPQIWRVAYPSGDVRQVTSEADNFDTLSLDGTASTIAAVQRSVRSNIWLSGLGDRPSQRFPSSLGTMEGKAGVSWTAAGRLVYSSFVSGDWVLLSSDADGNSVTQLTFGAGGDQDPIATADATRLLFASNRGGGRSIWVMDVDGGHVRQLTHGYLDWLPFPSPDGRIAYYASVANRRRTIWSVAIDGGTPKELSAFPCDDPAVSPDGRLIACYAGAGGASSGRVAIVPATGGDPVRVIDVPATFDRQVPFLRWLPDGRALAYVDTPNSVSNIRTLPLDAAPARQLTDFTTDRIFKFDVSPDGVRVITARGTTTTDVVLLRDFR